MNTIKIVFLFLTLSTSCTSFPAMTRAEKLAANAMEKKVKLITGLKTPGWEGEAKQLVNQLEHNYVEKGYEPQKIEELKREVIQATLPPASRTQYVPSVPTVQPISAPMEQVREPVQPMPTVSVEQPTAPRESLLPQYPAVETPVQQPAMAVIEAPVKESPEAIVRSVEEMLLVPVEKRESDWYGTIGQRIHQISLFNKDLANEFLKKVYVSAEFAVPVAPTQEITTPVGPGSMKRGGPPVAPSGGMKKGGAPAAPGKKAEAPAGETPVEAGEPPVGGMKRGGPPAAPGGMKKGPPAAPGTMPKGGGSKPAQKGTTAATTKKPEKVEEEVFTANKLIAMDRDAILKKFNEHLDKLNIGINWNQMVEQRIEVPTQHGSKIEVVRGGPQPQWQNTTDTFKKAIIEKGIDVRTPEEVAQEVKTKITQDDIAEEIAAEKKEEAQKTRAAIAVEKKAEIGSIKADAGDQEKKAISDEIAARKAAELETKLKEIETKERDIDKIKERIERRKAVEKKIADCIAKIRTGKVEEAKKLAASKPVSAEPTGEESEQDVIARLDALFRTAAEDISDQKWILKVEGTIRILNRLNPTAGAIYKAKLKALQQKPTGLRE